MYSNKVRNIELPENLFSNLGEGEKIDYYRASSGLDEVKYVIDKIKELMHDGVSLKDMVIYSTIFI